MNRIVYIFCLAIFMTACTTTDKNANSDTSTDITTEKNTEKENRNTSSMYAWVGTYEGVLPCADCAGIKTTIVLNANNKFMLSEVYLKGDGKTRYQKAGNFKLDKASSVLTLLYPGDDPDRLYKLGDGIITLLDKDGNMPTGELASAYVLKKE